VGIQVSEHLYVKSDSQFGLWDLRDCYMVGLRTRSVLIIHTHTCVCVYV